jgi:NAD(P)-dependent dehydrogenase (short-subunit alcohol dehydrogenase family)
MDLQLTGKTALVTGSTAGIGLAIVTELAREGATVVINGRSAERIGAAARAVKLAVPSASLELCEADLGTAAGVEIMTRTVHDVDILVNNLGIFEVKRFPEITDADWFRFFEVNVMSGVRLSRHYMPAMLMRNWGRVVFISSESALNVPVEMIHYGFTKTAQLALARGLAETTTGTGVTVNSVLPGPTMSEGVTGFVKGLAASQGVSTSHVEKEFFRTMRPSSLLKRFETPEEIAAIVAFICSPRASATNGAAVRADGGVVRSIV